MSRPNTPATGKRNASWHNRKMISSQGYVRIRVGKSHSLADGNGYAYEHLVVWCAAGHARPSRGYLLHHLNEDRADNRIENLELLTRGEHSRLHRATHSRDQKGRWAEQNEFNRREHSHA